MKRIVSACLLQTIHFKLKDDLEREAAERQVLAEVAYFKEHLKRTRTRYVLEEEQPQQDGSVLLRIRKQYNQYSVGNYLEV